MNDPRGISRRRFVAGAAGAALAMGASVPLLGCGGGGGRERGSVVVVGAGLAGLTAAYELRRSGWDVTVLEARDRVGGRCRTFRSELDFGQVAEAGGEFIDASHEAIRGYAARFGLELDDLRASEDDELAAGLHVDGELVDMDAAVDGAVAEEVGRFQEQVDRYAAAIDRADPARTGAGLDTRSVADLLDELEIDSDARALAEAELRAQYAVEAEDLSLLFHVVVTALSADVEEADVERYRIRGGNDQLPSAFADELRDVLSLRSPVESIAPRGAGVRVVAGGTRVDADHCVIAVPLPALREVELGVELPRTVRDAIARVRYGAVTKTALQYESRFWADEGWSGDVLTELPIQATWDATAAQDGDAGVLMTYSAGADGARLGELEPRERIEAAGEQVAAIFPDAASEPVAAATVAWGRERYSGGAYSAWAPGQYTRYWPALRRAHGPVHFAGEHTDLHASYMEGAVRSGQRVAGAIEARRAS